MTSQRQSIQILHGDVFECLAKLPEDHFDCVVTSPPYWGLRDYGVEGQIGLERTKEQASYDKARDRELQKLGFKVFRFTGSDIHQDANACAREVMEQVMEWNGTAGRLRR